MISYDIENSDSYEYIASNKKQSKRGFANNGDQTLLKDVKFKKNNLKNTSIQGLDEKVAEAEVKTEFNNVSYHNYSRNYIEYNLSKLTEQLLSEIELWENFGSIDGLVYIGNIKDILKKYQTYYHETSEGRIFFSLVRIIFESNMWADMTSSQIKQFKIELQRFNDGKVDEKEVKTFLKQLYRGNLFLFEKAKHDKN